MSAHPHDRHDESVSRERRAAAIMHLLNQEAATLHLGPRPVHPKQGGTGEIGGAAGREHNHSHAQPPTGPAMGSALAKARGTVRMWHRRRGGVAHCSTRSTQAAAVLPEARTSSRMRTESEGVNTCGKREQTRDGEAERAH